MNDDGVKDAYVNATITNIHNVVSPLFSQSNGVTDNTWLRLLKPAMEKVVRVALVLQVCLDFHSY